MNKKLNHHAQACHDVNQHTTTKKTRSTQLQCIMNYCKRNSGKYTKRLNIFFRYSKMCLHCE